MTIKKDSETDFEVDWTKYPILRQYFPVVLPGSPAMQEFTKLLSEAIACKSNAPHCEHRNARGISRPGRSDADRWCENCGAYGQSYLGTMRWSIPELAIKTQTLDGEQK